MLVNSMGFFLEYDPFSLSFQSPVVETCSDQEDKNLSEKEDNRYNLLLWASRRPEQTALSF